MDAASDGTGIRQATPHLSQDERIVVVADLAGFSKACRGREDLAVARFLDAHYQDCERAISGHGGRIVKFMGDGFLAVFDEQEIMAALAALGEVEEATSTLAERLGFAVGFGANVHLTTIALGELGAGPSRRFDVVGRGVNQAFLLGSGPGLRLSEPAYRSLPSPMRGPFEKSRPPAVYRLGDGAALSALGKDAPANSARF